MNHLFPTLLRASDASDLREKVAQAIADGKDLYTPLFNDYSGELCQFVIPSVCLYEYRLIEALDLEDLEAQARGLVALDFDFMFNTVLWQGKYLQWMQRMNERGTSVKEMIVSTPRRELVRPRNAVLALWHFTHAVLYGQRPADDRGQHAAHRARERP